MRIDGFTAAPINTIQSFFPQNGKGIKYQLGK